MFVENITSGENMKTLLLIAILLISSTSFASPSNLGSHIELVTKCGQAQIYKIKMKEYSTYHVSIDEGYSRIDEMDREFELNYIGSTFHGELPFGITMGTKINLQNGIKSLSLNKIIGFGDHIKLEVEYSKGSRGHIIIKSYRKNNGEKEFKRNSQHRFLCWR
jgi:hypothetical protein